MSEIGTWVLVELIKIIKIESVDEYDVETLNRTYNPDKLFSAEEVIKIIEDFKNEIQE